MCLKEGDDMKENEEITILEDKLYQLGLEEDRLYEEIQAIRKQCGHERYDGAWANAWWCGKCGGPMPKEAKERARG